MSASMQLDSPLDFALAYAGAGHRVLPLHAAVNGVCTCGKTDCASPGKHPRTKNGAHDATIDEVTIREWFKRWPDANIGMTLDNLVAIDVDPRNGGDTTLESLIAKHGKLPELRLILCADDDAATEGNPGLTKATAAVKAAIKKNLKSTITAKG